MKKSVIVLIGVIYIMAIAVVSFMGLKPDISYETVYVEKVECTNEDVKYDSEGKKYVVIPFSEDPEIPITYQIDWHVYPDNASTKFVKFVYNKDKTYVTVNEFGTVIFNRKGAITVYITSTDGTSKSDSITIIAK